MGNINNQKDIEYVFTYRAPFGTQVDRYVGLRRGGRELAALILVCCPPSRERNLAFTKLQEAVMWANASIAINEKPSEVEQPHEPEG